MFENIGFHEATLISIDNTQGSVCLCFEDVVQVEGQKVSGCLILNGVSRIEIDDVCVPSFKMESSDGEVIDLECGDRELNLIIQWNDFTNRSSVTRHHRVTYDSAQWIVA